MTIADTSSSLSTTWTEQSIVSFLAGTLAAIANCVTEVESKLRRGTLSAGTVPTSTEVQNWLIRGKQELCETKGYTWTRRYAYADTVAGTYRYALPPDYNGGPLSIRDMTSDRSVTIWQENVFDLKYPDPSAENNDEPTLATIKNMELWFAKPVDGVYRLELTYSRSGADNTTTDFSYLPEVERWRCCDFALSHAFMSLHQFDIGNHYKQEWLFGLKKAAKADARRKWAKLPTQAISLFQEMSIKS